MIRNIISWFIIFGLSHLIGYLGWASQGSAFIVIYLGFYVVTALIWIILAAISDYALKNKSYSMISQFFSVATTINTVLLIGFVLLSVWIATLLWNIDFYVAFQIMTFGFSLRKSEQSTIKIKRIKKSNDGTFNYDDDDE